MRKRNLYLITLSALGISIMLLFVYINSERGESNETAFERTIDKKLDTIVSPKDINISFSSNPYDYIKSADGKKAFVYIVSNKTQSLNYLMEEFENSSGNGLREYIMAIACSEILKESSSEKNWSSGRGWYNLYKENKK